MRLKNTVPLHPDETTPSFVSRLAFANGVPTIADLLWDAELTMPKFLKGDPKTFEMLSDLSGVSAYDLERQAFVPSGPFAYKIFGHELSQQHLLRAQSRVCPACLREDTGSQLAPQAMVSAYGRGLWSIASARVCPVHQLALVSPPASSVKHEFIDTWLPWMFEIVEGELDQEINVGGLYEGHVARSLAGERPEGWGSSFPVGVLGVICEMLGVSQMHGKATTLGALSLAELTAATSTGFQMLNAGASEVATYFERLRSDPGTPQDRPQARYGRIYDWLKRGAGSGPEFSPLRDILRQHILDKWPLGAGDQALDYTLTYRRLHSIRTAATTHDLHPKRLRRLLIDSGVIPESDLLDYEIVFELREAKDILEQASGSVSFSAAQKRLGLTRSQMETLIKAEVLRPGEGGVKSRPRFTEATIVSWLDYFASFPESEKWETMIDIAYAVRKYGVSTDRVVSLVLDDRIKRVFRVKGQNVFSAILIDEYELACRLRE